MEKKRNEIDAKYKWDLDAMIPNSDIEKLKKEVKLKLEEVLKFKGHITDSSENLYNFYKATDSLVRLIETLTTIRNMAF